MPDAVEMPAPASTTMRLRVASSAASAAMLGALPGLRCAEKGPDMLLLLESGESVERNEGAQGRARDVEVARFGQRVSLACL